ncbi:hypothetical protein ACP2AV_13725 [Aliiroseovarius sp. PTFE2010]|uniref:hypothetical protein n=1 Tax=Aliiroseovarius sp. PTFE2010 TaxID=3417190 RepID=UPI003CF2D382
MKRFSLFLFAVLLGANQAMGATVALTDFTPPPVNTQFNPWAFTHVEALLEISVVGISGDDSALRLKTTTVDRTYGLPSKTASYSTLGANQVLVSEFEQSGFDLRNVNLLYGPYYERAAEKRDYTFEFQNSGAGDAVVTMQVQTGIALQAEYNPAHRDNIAAGYAVTNAFGESSEYATSLGALHHLGLYYPYRSSLLPDVVASGFIETSIFYVDLLLPAGQTISESAQFQIGALAIAPTPGAFLSLATGLGLFGLWGKSRRTLA